jgi:Ubiquitin interaction motif
MTPVGNQVEKERVQDDSIIEDQFDEFLSRLELLESEDYNGMDDEELDFSIKERILMIKVERTAFDPLLLLLRTTRPALYQAVLQHPLIAGQLKATKNKSKKEKKRDRKNEINKEKEKLLSQSRMTRSQRRDKNSFSSDSKGAIGTLADLRSSPEKRSISGRETLAAMVAKTIVEGSLSGHLVAIALLMQVMKDERHGASAIPIGNILAGMFERPDVDDESDTSDAVGASSTQNSTGSTRENPYLANPFHSYLLCPRDEPAKSVAYSDMSRGDVGSIDETRTEDTASQLGVGDGSGGYPGPHSDAGSTVGSTRAEQGTETASVDEDGTEDEQLAQALAMSMRGTAVNSSIDASAAYEINMRVKSYSANSSAASSSGPVSFTGDRSKVPTLPTFPKIEPLSTFGPFSSPEYWRLLSPNEYPDHLGDIPMVSLRHTVIALLTVIRAGADKVLGDDFSLSQQSPCQSGGVFDAHQGPTTVYIVSTPPITPNPPLFLLLELLLDQLITELKNHCKITKSDPSSTKREAPSSIDTAGTPLTQILLKERERKGKQTLFATQAAEKPLTEAEIEMREWAFHRYFLVWSINSILRVLRASLCTARDLRYPNSSLGLSVPGDEADADLAFESENKFPRSNSFPGPSAVDFTRPAPPTSQPLAVRLLHHVESCLGLTLDAASNSCPAKTDLQEALLSSEARDALCTKLLQYQPQPMKQAGTAATGNLPCYPEQHSLVGYRHALRISAIDCYVSGLSVFRPLQADRDSLLCFLLRNTLKPQDCGRCDYSAELFGLLGTGDSQRSQSGCLTYFLQEVCLLNAHTISKIRSGSSPREARQSQGNKSESTATLRDSGGSHSKSSGLPNTVYDDSELESILFDRLKYANLAKASTANTSPAVGVETDGPTASNAEDQIQSIVAPKNLVYWGELQLLHTLQKKLMKAFSESTGTNVPYSPSQICFNVRRCHQDIAISGDSKVVTHRNSKVREEGTDRLGVLSTSPASKSTTC